MNINHIPSVTRVGEITWGQAPRVRRAWHHYDTKLTMLVDNELTRELYTTQMAIVYLITLDGEIVKIGQTSGKGGVKGCFSFYLGAGFGADGPPRFNINALIRESLTAGKKVEVYMIYKKPTPVDVPGLFGSSVLDVNIDAKVMETKCQEEYKIIEGDYPEWCYQERGVECPRHIVESYNTFRVNRQSR